jgi:hypothetical protein
MENQTTEVKLNAKFEAFKEETRRMNRSYWASVRRAEEQVQGDPAVLYSCA